MAGSDSRDLGGQREAPVVLCAGAQLHDIAGLLQRLHEVVKQRLQRTNGIDYRPSLCGCWSKVDGVQIRRTTTAVRKQVSPPTSCSPWFVSCDGWRLDVMTSTAPSATSSSIRATCNHAQPLLKALQSM
jgi:hypothetical protein